MLYLLSMFHSLDLVVSSLGPAGSVKIKHPASVSDNDPWSCAASNQEDGPGCGDGQLYTEDIETIQATAGNTKMT